MRGADRRHRKRERRAHGRAARQQRQRDEDTGDEVIGGRVPRERRARRGEEGMACAEPGRDGEREDADGRFGGRVAHEPEAGIDPARAQAAAEPAAEREPRHEHRQHDRDERCRHAEGGHGEPEPDDLVDEACEPRAEEEEEPPGEGRTTGRAGQYHATAIVQFAPRTSRRESDACVRLALSGSLLGTDDALPPTMGKAQKRRRRKGPKGL